MTCVSSATASVLVNGSPTEEFRLGRGLRRRDTLSPFLFLIATEGLNVMLKASIANDLFKGCQFGNEDTFVVRVSHHSFPFIYFGLPIGGN
jgi:hypothetical protein